MSSNNGSSPSTTPRDMHTNQGPVPGPVSAPPAAPPTNRGGRKPRSKRWAKADLLDIAPMASTSMTAPQTGKPDQVFGSRRHGGSGRGVNVDGESLGEVADRLARLELEKANKPLTEFTLFSSLPKELRYKIWSFAARAETRILELVVRPDSVRFPSHSNEATDDDLTWASHRIFDVSEEGQREPAIMRANHESRREAMRVFEKRHINSYKPNHYAQNGMRPWTWYNPYNDIIFFGESTCITTVLEFFRLKSDEKYARVAFRCGNMIGTCINRCNYDVSEIADDDEEEWCRRGRGVGGGISVMGVLHGKDEEIAFNSLVPGAPAVEEVFFVVKTECMKFEAGAMPNNLTFRPAIHNGLTGGQERTKGGYEVAIRRVRSGQGVPGCGENRWDSGNHPEFSFVSLAPPLKDSKGKALKHDAIMVPTKDIGKLIYRNNEFLHDLGNKTRVDIVPSEKAYVGQKNREIGLYNGTKEGIEKAKEEIKKQLLVDFESVRRGPNKQNAGRGRGGQGGRAGKKG